MNRVTVFFILAVAAFGGTLLTTPAHAGYNPMMGPDEEADRFAQRIHARHGIMPKGLYRQPMGAGDFLAFLDSASALPLTPQERTTLEGLRRRLSPDRGIYGFRYDDNDAGAVVNLDLTGEVWARDRGGAGIRGGGRGIISPSMGGHAGNVSFYTAVDVWTEYVYDSMFSASSFQPYNGLPHELYGVARDSSSVRSQDVTRYGVGYDAGRISLLAAMDYLRVGPAVHYPVTLSGQTPPIVYARAVFDLKYIEYQHAAGFLRSQKNRGKYIYTGRLSGAFLNGRLLWGINQVVIDGSATNQQDGDPENRPHANSDNRERAWEWAYAVPFSPMLFVGHYIGNNDNGAISFDASVTWPQNFRFYGEFFIDDMSAPWSIFSNDFRNKWAMTLGMQYFTTLYGRDASAGLEWSRVEPWVYTHFDGGSHRYDHFDKPLGSPLGPNSMAVVASGDVSLTKKTAAGLKLTSLSSNPSARGGKITDIFRFEDPESPDVHDSWSKKFLGPGTVHHLRPGVYGHYDPFGLFWFNTAVEVDVARDRGRVHFNLDGGFRF